MFLQREMYHIQAGTTLNRHQNSRTTNMTEHEADFSLLQCLQANATLDAWEAQKEIYALIYAILKLNTL